LSDLNENKAADKSGTQTTDPVITDELKKEAAESVNQVKEIIKNVDIKEEAKKTHGFLKDMLVDPIGKIKTIAGNTAEFFHVSVIILALWVAASFLSVVLAYTGRTWVFGNVIQNIFSIVMSTISPVVAVLVMSAIAYLFLKDKIKQITPVVIIIIIASTPRVMSAVINILPSLISTSSRIVSPITSFLYIVSVILVYFGLKALSGENKDEVFFKKYMMIQGAYFVTMFVLAFLSIHI